MDNPNKKSRQKSELKSHKMTVKLSQITARPSTTTAGGAQKEVFE